MCNIKPWTILRALYYLGVFRKLNPTIPLTPFTAHRLILPS
jgi:hypothetical protein